MFKSQLTGSTNPVVAEVCNDGGLYNTSLPHPPIDYKTRIRPFVGNLTVNGDGVTSSLSVNGSSTSVTAFVSPPSDGDLYITTANVLIADNAAISLNRFGGIVGGLINGIDFFVEQQNERFIFALGVKTNFDMIRIATLTKAIGTKTDAYQLSNTDTNNNDGYNPILDFTRVSPLGIRLVADTSDKLGIVINDNLTSIETFTIVTTGFVRLKD